MTCHHLCFEPQRMSCPLIYQKLPDTTKLIADPAPAVSNSESADRRSALEAAARAMPMDHVRTYMTETNTCIHGLCMRRP